METSNKTIELLGFIIGTTLGAIKDFGPTIILVIILIEIKKIRKLFLWQIRQNNEFEEVRRKERDEKK